jgi:hypothetical protein
LIKVKGRLEEPHRNNFFGEGQGADDIGDWGLVHWYLGTLAKLGDEMRLGVVGWMDGR